MNDVAVNVRNVSKQFGALTVLDHVSLTVARGSFHGLLGPNGAGKTTLIATLGGLVRPTSGGGTVLEKDIVTETLAVRKVLGIVPQELIYDPFFKVREALVFQSKYYGLHDNGVWIDTLLSRLALQDKRNTNTRALSGGMKRRLMIAQALVHKPPVIVLDEPTAGVDINLRLSLWKFIRELNAAGHTIILTTHYLEEAETLCDHVTLMNNGRVIFSSSKKNLLSAHHTASVAIRARGGRPEAIPRACRVEKNGAYLFNLADYNDLESLLAAFRQAGAAIEEVAVKPPRLEDAFVQMIGRE